MTIHWDFETVTEQRTDEDGEQYTTEKRGPIRVWFHDRDPATEEPHQTVDWRAEDMQPTTGGTGYPDCVRTAAARREIAAELAAAESVNRRIALMAQDLLSEDVVRLD